MRHHGRVLLLDGSGGLGTPWAELAGPPDLTLLRDAVRILRRLDREEEIDLVYFGGVRSGTDAAKVIALGAVAVVLGVIVGLAAGGTIAEDHTMSFTADRTDEDRQLATANILKATAGEASMMARCTGKTNLHNIEPEDMRALTLATAAATDIPLAGLSRRRLQELIGWLEHKEYRRGEIVFKEGDRPDGLYLLSSGEVSVDKDSDDISSR